MANNDAERGQEDSLGRGITEDPLIRNLGLDPSQIPTGVVSAVGFVGRDVDEGLVRVYLSINLDEYLVIRREDIISTQQLGTEQSLVGGSLVFVRSSAELKYVHVETQQLQAEFLRGSISSTYGFDSDLDNFTEDAVRAVGRRPGKTEFLNCDSGPRWCASIERCASRLRPRCQGTFDSCRSVGLWCASLALGCVSAELKCP
jgi:hypothetical protein